MIHKVNGVGVTVPYLPMENKLSAPPILEEKKKDFSFRSE